MMDESWAEYRTSRGTTPPPLSPPLPLQPPLAVFESLLLLTSTSDQLDMLELSPCTESPVVDTGKYVCACENVIGTAIGIVMVAVARF